MTFLIKDVVTALLQENGQMERSDFCMAAASQAASCCE